MTIFRTIVTELPATPLGLLPARWIIEHRCATCHQQVLALDLVAHAQDHQRHTIQHQGGAID